MEKLKITSIGVILIVLCFYITNQTIIMFKEKDPLMQTIKEEKNQYEQLPENAEIIGNTIIVGKKGQTIDYNKTYYKMKKYASYNEALITTKEVKPTISIENYYDKYIVRGNKSKKEIAFVFPIREDKELPIIEKVLKSKDVPGTFFLDGTVLESNTKRIKSNNVHEFEVLSYNNSYQESFLKTSFSYLEIMTKKGPKYCYTEEDNEELLKLCSKKKLHTIKPSYIIKKDLYMTIKQKIANSLIISIEVNNKNIKELSMTIDYVREKGYNLVILEELLKE